MIGGTIAGGLHFNGLLNDTQKAAREAKLGIDNAASDIKAADTLSQSRLSDMSTRERQVMALQTDAEARLGKVEGEIGFESGKVSGLEKSASETQSILASIKSDNKGVKAIQSTRNVIEHVKPGMAPTFLSIASQIYWYNAAAISIACLFFFLSAAILLYVVFIKS